jgi:glycosyltransferase involved in cell wall biosynthesis
MSNPQSKTESANQTNHESTHNALNTIRQLEEMVGAEVSSSSSSLARPTLTVIIPVYNECETILDIVRRVAALEIDKQIVVVDDGSTDGTREVLAQLDGRRGIDVFMHSENRGKGAALQTGFCIAEGEILIVQDADLEYDPQEILKVIQPILDGDASVVYGSRYLSDTHSDGSWLHRLGNQTLTAFSNAITRQKLTDMETCYKAFRRELMEDISIQQCRFGFEPEITGKLARRGVAIHEVPISYKPRSWDEGKKIGIKDLFNALYCIVRYGLFD